MKEIERTSLQRPYLTRSSARQDPSEWERTATSSDAISYLIKEALAQSKEVVFKKSGVSEGRIIDFELDEEDQPLTYHIQVKSMKLANQILGNLLKTSTTGSEVQSYCLFSQECPILSETFYFKEIS